MRALAAIVSSLHVFALALGLAAVFFRGRALRGPLDQAGLLRLFAADNVWGLAAALWLVTGLARAFGGLEKGSAFYLGSSLFWAKMVLFAFVVLLEIRLMLTFIRWRAILRKGGRPDTAGARGLYIVSHIQMGIVVAMVFVASFMARGF